MSDENTATEKPESRAWRPYIYPIILSVVAVNLSALGAFLVMTHYENFYLGMATFMFIPFMGGFLAVLHFNFENDKTNRQCLKMSLLSGVIALSLMLLAGLEGIICLAMAAPVALPLNLVGGAMALSLTRRFPNSRTKHTSMGIVLLFTPLMMGVEPLVSPSASVREVLSHIDIQAPPEAVWEQVVAFSPITEAPSLIFRLGIAYPTHAEIVGEGVGAVRYCHFSTGPFVEPITHWEPPHRLAFDVTAQPHPMKEWSPYPNLYPPHLDNTLESIRGEFRLIPLEDGGTRLEGSTWYRVHLAPTWYWGGLSDHIIHRIHLRVLEHIAREAAQSP